MLNDSYHIPFKTTNWTQLKQDAEEGSLGQFCESYWLPLYAHARRKGFSTNDAKDVVQGFFLNMFNDGWIENADATKGRLRTFLLTVLDRYIVSEWRKEYAEKRGGGVAIVSIDELAAESWYESTSKVVSGDQIFDYGWACALLNQSMEDLHALYASKGMERRFEVMKEYLDVDEADAKRTRYAEMADQLGMTEGAVKVAVLRMRDQFRQLLVSKVELTIDPEDDVDADGELRYLLSVLAHG